MTETELADLRAELPAEAFKPSLAKLVILLAHFAVVLGCYLVVGYHHKLWLTIPAGLTAGHSLAVIGLFSHELTHGMILKGRNTVRLVEWFFWPLLFVSPTMWRRAHNQTHHVCYNTPADCDRMFFKGEKTMLRTIYVQLTYPNAEVLPWNPLVWLYMMLYFLRSTLAAFVPKLFMIPSLPSYRPGDRYKIILDLGVIALTQYALFLAVGSHWVFALLMLVISQMTASVIVMGYIFTNHFLKPVIATADPLACSTSVIVPRWVDWLHAHFSYHTEHHIFPAMNSDYYPELSRLLHKRYPQRYHRIPIGEAWRQLWRQPPFLKDPHEH